MSTKLRYDIGVRLADYLDYVNKTLLADLNGERVQRWHGYGDGRGNIREDPRSDAVTFGVWLPRDVGPALRLVKELRNVVHGGTSGGRDMTAYRTGQMYRSALPVLTKLSVSLGLPELAALDVAAALESRCAGLVPFVEAVGVDPDDLASWLVMADWCEEFGGEDEQWRAGVIRAWSGRKHVKAKYGVLTLVPDWMAWRVENGIEAAGSAFEGRPLAEVLEEDEREYADV